MVDKARTASPLSIAHPQALEIAGALFDRGCGAEFGRGLVDGDVAPVADFAQGVD